MRTLLAFLLLSTACLAQPAQQPDDADKYWFCVFTHADWAKRPDEKALIENLQKEPLLGLIQKHRFRHYTTGQKIYQERYAEYFPEDTFPVVVRQKPDGGYVYKASGSAVPGTSKGLLDEIRFFAQLTPSEGQDSVQQDSVDTEDEYDSDRPFDQPNNLDDALPDSVTIFGGGTPLRDSMGLSVQILVLMFSICVLVVMIFALLLAFKHTK